MSSNKTFLGTFNLKIQNLTRNTGSQTHAKVGEALMRVKGGAGGGGVAMELIGLLAVICRIQGLLPLMFFLSCYPLLFFTSLSYLLLKSQDFKGEKRKV